MTITITKSKFHIIEAMSDNDAGKLIKALINEAKGQEQVKMPRSVQIALKSFEKKTQSKQVSNSIPTEVESECLGFVSWLPKIMTYSSEVQRSVSDANRKKNYCGVYCKLRASYSKEDIKKAILFAAMDSFWQNNFLSPMKLIKTNKDGTKYIDVFLTQAALKEHEKQKAIGYNISELS